MKIHNELCAVCKSGKKPKKLMQVGKPSMDVMSVGTGVDRTETTKYACVECGSIWINTVDSAAGGHGSFWTQLP